MSKTDSKQTEMIKSEAGKKFWRDPRVRDIFNLFTQGKDINAMSETLSIKPITIEGLITNKFFIAKLEAHIRGVLFTNQVAKVIAASNIFSKLWDRVTDNIEEIPPEICLKELTKLFPTKKEGMIINPKNMNIFMKVMKGEIPQDDLDQRLTNLDNDLGFDGLEDDSQAVYPELHERSVQKFKEDKKEDGKQQGDPSMDQKKPSQNEQRTSD